jgi:hypothetical protein
VTVSPIFGIEQVCEVKLLGVYFNSNLKFVSHVNYILKQCSQRSFLLKQLRNQGLSKKHLSIVFEAIILCRLRYSLPAWAGFITKELEGRIDAFLRRMFVYGYCLRCFTVSDLIYNCDLALFKSVSKYAHCLNQLVQYKNVGSHLLRSRGHNFILPACNFELYKHSFINRCLFNFV